MSSSDLPRSRFTSAETAAIRAYAVSRWPGGCTVELATEEEGDALHVTDDATGDALVSFGLDRGRVHAVGPTGTVLAEAADVDRLVAALRRRPATTA